jgi:hypothetical protein
VRELYYNERANQMALSHLGTQFTYFTGTNVQKLTELLQCANWWGSASPHSLIAEGRMH